MNDTTAWQVSEIETAIAGDEDIQNIVVRPSAYAHQASKLNAMQKGKEDVDFAEYLQQIRPPVTVDGAGKISNWSSNSTYVLCQHDS